MWVGIVLTGPRRSRPLFEEESEPLINSALPLSPRTETNLKPV